MIVAGDFYGIIDSINGVTVHTYSKSQSSFDRLSIETSYIILKPLGYDHAWMESSMGSESAWFYPQILNGHDDCSAEGVFFHGGLLMIYSTIWLIQS